MQNELTRLPLSPKSKKPSENLCSAQIILYFCRVIARCTNFSVRYTIYKLFDISYVRALYKRVRLPCITQAATQYGPKWIL